MKDLNSPPQLNSLRGRIFTLDKCTTARITPVNESSTFHGAGRDAESAKKTILDKNELSKRILGTAIEVLIVRREATVVFLPFKPLAYFASLR